MGETKRPLGVVRRATDRLRNQGRKGQVKTARAERTYARQLKSIGRHVGEIIAGFEPGDIAAFPALNELLSRYAQALQPWAIRTAEQMLLEVDARDRESWRALGNAISQSLHNDIERTPIGDRIRELLREQVTLIQSIPTEAAQRVHELTIKGLEDSTRAREHVEEIQRSGDVAQSRAVLIARTEVGRTASTLVQTRAEHVGSLGYIWRDSRDGDVRPSHKAMAGKFVRWDEPQTLDNMTGHAGCFPNCRCYPEPVISDD